jgi:hypothetical protein
VQLSTDGELINASRDDQNLRMRRFVFSHKVILSNTICRMRDSIDRFNLLALCRANKRFYLTSCFCQFPELGNKIELCYRSIINPAL